MKQQWFSVIGLALDLVGVVIIIFKGTYFPKVEQAETLTHDWVDDVTYKKGRPAGELVKIVAVLAKASHWSVVGFGVIALGMIFQVIGSWP